jgi:YD repeat-containing protein
MGQIMQGLGGTLLALAALALATAAPAQVDFKSMPVGCSWTTRYSSGEVQTETYLGRKGGKHLTKVTSGQNTVRRMTYDSKGRMTRKDWADGNWETFTPYSCFSIEGNCTYRYRNSSGADQTIESTTTASGKGFVVVAGPVGEARYNDDYFETGSFGLMTVNRSANYSNQLIELRNCDLQG